MRVAFGRCVLMCGKAQLGEGNMPEEDNEEVIKKYVARNSSLAASTPDGGMIIMSPIDSRFFALSHAAAAIWQAADGETPLSEIVSTRICSEFDVDPDTAEKDAQQFVDELSAEGIMLVSEQPIRSLKLLEEA